MKKSEFDKIAEFREGLVIISDEEFNTLKIKREDDILSLTDEEKIAYILYLEDKHWDCLKLSFEVSEFDDEGSGFEDEDE